MKRFAASSPEAFPAEAAWLGRLARSLADEAKAEEVVQRAHGAAGPASRALSRPSWLAAVLRQVGGLRHGGSPRGQRGSLRAREGLPAPEEVLAERQARRLVAAAVEHLAEPYRSTVLLCCAEGLPLREVARRQGQVEATVCWRLQRGLDRLRRAIQTRAEPPNLFGAKLRGGFGTL